MSSQEAEHVSPIEVTPTLGKGTLDTWRFHRQRGAGLRAGVKPSHVVERGCGQTTEVGVYADQRFSLADVGKAHGRKAKVPNRTWENRPSGIIGGPPET
jgi:hypothetical protein